MAVLLGAATARADGKRVGGHLGGLLAAGVGVNGQVDSGQRAYVDTSVLFAFRGGLLLGEGHRWVLSVEVAPATNRLDWRRSATVTGILSVGNLVPIRSGKEWAWFWKVGVGAGGGRDYRFLIAAQLDVLTFNYKMSNRLWVDLGIPTVRFHVETGDRGLWNVQLVFPLGITFAL